MYRGLPSRTTGFCKAVERSVESLQTSLGRPAKRSSFADRLCLRRFLRVVLSWSVSAWRGSSAPHLSRRVRPLRERVTHPCLKHCPVFCSGIYAPGRGVYENGCQAFQSGQLAPHDAHVNSGGVGSSRCNASRRPDPSGWRSWGQIAFWCDAVTFVEERKKDC